MTIINTNLASINAQRNLSSTQTALTTSMQRLSSGSRINSAKDDSAGLAISERISSQIGGMNQAARNANDAISLAQTAEGALQQITSNLQRIRDLAVQAANGSNQAIDRASLNNEASQIISEIDRIASSTTFNGVNLIDGSFNSQTFQVGANNSSSDQINISSIASARSSALGVGSTSSYSTRITGTGLMATPVAFANGDLVINGYRVGASTSDGVSYVYANASSIAKATAINAISGSTGVTATVGPTVLPGVAVTNGGAISAGDLRINGVPIAAIAAVAGPNLAAQRGSQVAAAVNAISSQTGVTANFSTTNGAVTLIAADGRNISLVSSTNASSDRAYTGIDIQVNAIGDITSAISLTSNSSAGITIAEGTTNAAANTGFTAGFTSASVTVGAGLSSLNLGTVAGASSALNTVDAAIQTVSTSRATLGAYQNRLTSAITNLQTNSENLSAARSRIRDTDYAQETASLTRAQVLQQAGTAILAQANSLPNNALSLLR
ncbi:flagellin [Undibacterium cyanobacteriorum]|uniref:Flagellin n=1 Tax=Undibacterium cyanobacteriorum TaxID=3073561 RepID=A0ABY9RL55_9BURK|nr:flagellin [Undibacterium sp. 20NA77.5]WMW81951.1 flagellin [Undibacterium sp. 20NA77.5]